MGGEYLLWGLSRFLRRMGVKALKEIEAKE
jgi:hypothetical protein